MWLFALIKQNVNQKEYGTSIGTQSYIPLRAHEYTSSARIYFMEEDKSLMRAHEEKEKS